MSINKYSGNYYPGTEKRPQTCSKPHLRTPHPDSFADKMLRNFPSFTTLLSLCPPHTLILSE